MESDNDIEHNHDKSDDGEGVEEDAETNICTSPSAEDATAADALTIEAAKNPFTTNHVTLEALENTKVAVAQFAASMCDPTSENALKELAVLQSTLFSLQHQQVLQLQLIQQLQSHIALNNKAKEHDRGDNDSDVMSDSDERESEIKIENNKNQENMSYIDVYDEKIIEKNNSFENPILNLVSQR